VEAGVSVEVLMHLTEHPVVDQALADGEVPKEFVGAISQVLHVSLDMFSEWTGAPILVQLKRLRREYRRERETFRAISERLGEADDETGLAIMERYFNSEPSAYFSEQLVAKYPEIAARIDKSG
jgi:hypothetical protein